MNRRLVSLLAVTLVLLAGCSGGEEPTAQDDAFAKDLEAAAAKNPPKPGEGKRGGGVKADNLPGVPGGSATGETAGAQTTG
jgi:hypothetical protein